MHNSLNYLRFQGGWHCGYFGEAKKERNRKTSAWVILALIHSFTSYLSGCYVTGTLLVSSDTPMNETKNRDPALLNIIVGEAANKHNKQVNYRVCENVV